MKPVIALAFLLSISAVAQTTTTYQYIPVSLKVHVPCSVNAGRGEDITFTGNAYQVTTIVNENGVRHGAIFYNTRDLIGKGASTGLTYVQVGSWQETFTGVTSTVNAAGVIVSGNGDYHVITTFSLGVQKTNVIFRNDVQFVFTNDGNLETLPHGFAGETACK